MAVRNIESGGAGFEPMYDRGVTDSELPSGLFSGKLQDIERDSFLDGRDASLLGIGLGALSGGYLFSGVDSSGLPGDYSFDEVREILNTDIESLDEVEGIDSIDSYEDFLEEVPNILENAPELVGYSFDNFVHLSLSGAASNMVAHAVDKLSDEYDPKKAALAGMAVVPLYVIFKEGWYEGGPGIDFDFGNTDVQGDIMMDTIGAAIGVYSYHKNHVDRESYSPGKAGKVARKAGRAYAKLEHALGNQEYELSQPEPEEIELEDGMDHIDYISHKHENYEEGEELDQSPDVKMPRSPDIPPNLTVESQEGYGQTAAS